MTAALHSFTVGQPVFPRWSQCLPAFKVVRVGAVMLTVKPAGGTCELMHYKDLVVQDPAAAYPQSYRQLG